MNTCRRFVLVNRPPYVDMDFEEAPEEDDSDEEIVPESPLQKILAREMDIPDFDNSTEPEALKLICDLMDEAVPQLIFYKRKNEILMEKFNKILQSDVSKNRRFWNFAKNEKELGDNIRRKRKELAGLRKYIRDNSEGGFEVENERKTVKIAEASNSIEEFEDNNNNDYYYEQKTKKINIPDRRNAGKHSDWSPKKYKKRSAPSTPKSGPRFHPYEQHASFASSTSIFYPESENFTSGPLTIDKTQAPPPQPLFEHPSTTSSSSSSYYSNYFPSGPIIEEIFD